MGWASEQIIAEHNARMESDDVYAEECHRQWAEEDDYHEWRMQQLEKYYDWFDYYRLAHDGYEEFDEADLQTDFDFEDIPF